VPPADIAMTEIVGRGVSDGVKVGTAWLVDKFPPQEEVNTPIANKSNRFIVVGFID